MEERKRKSSLEKAMKSLGTVEVYYAKIICRLSNATRLKLYRKLASLLRNRFSLMNALDMIHEGASNGGKNPKEPMAIAIAAWGQALQNGKPFSEALRGWAPNQERLMLSVGDVSDMESAIMNLIRVSEGSTKMVRPIIGADCLSVILVHDVRFDYLRYRRVYGAADAGSSTKHKMARHGCRFGRLV